MSISWTGLQGKAVYCVAASNILPLVSGVMAGRLPSAACPGDRYAGRVHADKGYDYKHSGNPCVDIASSFASRAAASNPTTTLGRQRWGSGIQRLECVRSSPLRSIHVRSTRERNGWLPAARTGQVRTCDFVASQVRPTCREIELNEKGH